MLKSVPLGRVPFFPALAQVAFADWPALNAECQNRVTRLVATAPEVQRQQLLALAAQSGVKLPGL